MLQLRLFFDWMHDRPVTEFFWPKHLQVRNIQEKLNRLEELVFHQLDRQIQSTLSHFGTVILP